MRRGLKRTLIIDENIVDVSFPLNLQIEHLAARRRRNHDMVEEGVNIVPTLRNRVVIFLELLEMQGG